MRLQTHILLLILLAALSGCASDVRTLASDNEGTVPQDNNDTSATRSAEARLYAHDIEGARAEYEAAAEASPGRTGGPAAGIAVTSILLLPYSNATSTILTSHLGARNRLDAQGDVIWGEDGLIYFIARGVAWDDSPSTAGIKTLLVDRLPWTRQQLDTVNGFVRGLNNPVALLAEDLPDLAEELAGISSQLGIAIADESFDTFFLPGEVFHDETLDLTLGKSELSLLRGVLKGAEAVLYFAAAYEHAWTLERALGETIWQPVIDDPMDPDHIPGGDVIDYQVAHLNESLGRALTTGERLTKAQQATGEMLRALADGVRLGIEEQFDTTLDWSNADELVATQLGEFLDALADSTEGRTALPHTDPEQSADLSLLFEGRTVPVEHDLLLIDTYDDGIGMVSEVVVNEEVLQDVFLADVFDPAFDTEIGPELTIGDDVERLIDGVSSGVAEDFERSVGSAF